MRIKRWALLTVACYALALAALGGPLIAAAFAERSSSRFANIRDGAAEVYSGPGYWITVGILTLLFGVFLLVPIEIARERPASRKRWAVLAAVSGLMVGILLGSLVFAVGEVVQAAAFENVDDEGIDLSAHRNFAALFGGAGWIIWGVIFWRFYRTSNQRSALRRVVAYLLAGSTAELLVAVPAHIYVRSKDYCCAGALTFVGLATGTAVMLFAFGPGAFFLFADRVRRLRPPLAEGGREPFPRILDVLGTQSKDALLGWTASLSFLGLPPLFRFLLGTVPETALLFTASSVGVFGAAGCVHAVLACLRRENLWGLILAGAFFWFEAAAILLCAFTLG